MDAQRVNILHIAHLKTTKEQPNMILLTILILFPGETHGDTVVKGIPDHLILNLLPSLKALVDEHLLGVGERCRDETLQLTSTRGEPRAKATEGIGSTD